MAVVGGATQTVTFANLAPVFDSLAGPLVVNGTNGNNAISYSEGSSIPRELPGRHSESDLGPGRGR